jgi:selenobiotic family peptide radical SAM maturase
MMKSLADIYPACLAVLEKESRSRLLAACRDMADPALFPDFLEQAKLPGLPPFLPDLAKLEWAVTAVSGSSSLVPREVDALCINPVIRLLELSWRGLTRFLHQDGAAVPEQGSERVLVWFDPARSLAQARPASDEDLLVLKMVAEGISAEAVAAEGGLAVGAVDAAIDRAVQSGILLAPPTRIRRDTAVFIPAGAAGREFLSSPSFTLQWHITQVCDLHCKHCYDRSDRATLPLEKAIRVLNELRTFTKERGVSAAVSFTGGNPLLHPDFTAIYRAAVDRNFSVAILGNPAPAARIEELIAIQKPAFFQVSLEGLPAHNDSIRGPGHFERIMKFLGVLRDLNVSSMVMLTLTRANQDQVLPLAELLRDKADVFHFNRLSLFGEGANLMLPERDTYRQFLAQYLEAAEKNPVMGIKDNLINILRHEEGRELFGGCTGYGCGAAFNFFSLLADGEVHACRKFPSPIGNIHQQGLAEIYDSAPAQRYRRGCNACQGCAIRPACGGCLAGAYSRGLNVFEEKDPFCFMR